MNEEMKRNQQYIRDITPVRIVVNDDKIIDASFGDVKCLEIDTRKATYRGHKLNEASSFEKRKFENLLILADPKQRLRFTYI